MPKKSKKPKQKYVVEPYIWFKARLQQGIQPFITIPDNINIVGEIEGINPKFQNSILKKMLRIFYLNNIIYLNDTKPFVSMTFKEALIPEIKVKIKAKDLIESVIERDYDKEGVGLNILRHSDYCKGLSVTPTNLTALSSYDISETASHADGTDRYGFLLKPFILSPTDIDWLVRAQRLWLQQAKQYNIVQNRKPFLISVVGGPKVYTSFTKSNEGGDYTDGGRINIRLPNRLKSIRGLLNAWTKILVHEYVHFLQYLFVKVNPKLKQSWNRNVPLSNIKKYYSSMWERDAYALEYLWKFLNKQNLGLASMASWETLKLYFNPQSFKQFLKGDSEIRWHTNRIGKENGEKWINGLVVAANKFVYDISNGEYNVDMYKEEASDANWTMLPYKYADSDIVSECKDKAGFVYAVNAEYYRYEPCSTKLPDIMSRVSLYVQ